MKWQWAGHIVRQIDEEGYSVVPERRKGRQYLRWQNVAWLGIRKTGETVRPLPKNEQTYLTINFSNYLIK